ncbi:MAG: hypothetical protein OXH36_03185 [Bdellovibrionales bacterium]|nr:hypothetical protein [Bdellovibrionales bacterium]
MIEDNKDIQKFIISYDGQVMRESHSMSVEDLAPSLLALDKVFQISNTLLNGINSNAHLKVSGQRSGSFEVVLYLAQYLPEVMSIIETYKSADLFNIIFGKLGLFDLIKSFNKNNSKLPISIQNLNINGDIYNAEVIKIFNGTIKENKKFLKPLQNRVGEIKALDEKNRILKSINREEAHAFLQYQIEEEVNTTTNTFKKYYHIITLNFEEDKGKLKWKLSDNSLSNHSVITALIEDKEFINKVEGSLLSFSKGDILKCQVREEQKEVGGKLNSSYFIEKVLEHKPSLKQMNLL